MEPADLAGYQIERSFRQRRKRARGCPGTNAAPLHSPLDSCNAIAPDSPETQSLTPLLQRSWTLCSKREKPNVDKRSHKLDVVRGHRVACARCTVTSAVLQLA